MNRQTSGLFRSGRRNYAPSLISQALSNPFNLPSYTPIKKAGKVFFVLALLFPFFSVNPAQAQEAVVRARVCTQDMDGNIPLAGTTVVAQVGEQQPVAGTTAADGCVLIEIEEPTSIGVEDGTNLSRGFELAAPYPNPARNEVALPFNTDISQPVRLALYDITGREVMAPFAAQVPAGLHRFTIDMGGLMPGLYVYRVQGINGLASGKVVKAGGSTGGSVSVRLDAGADVVPQFPTVRSSAAGVQAMTVQFDAVRQGYQTAHTTEEVSNGSEVVLIMESLMPGVPSAPLLTAPANGAVGIQESGVTIRWQGDDLAISYAIQVSESQEFTSVAYQVEGVANSATQVSGLEAATTYFWRVRSTGNDGTSEWSLVYRFTTLDNTLPVPGIPTLQSPSNGASNVALPTVNLNWDASTNASNYNVQLATDTDFTSLVLDVSSIPNTSVTTPELAGGTTYYWRVQANGDGGSSDWSAVYAFDTELVGSVPDVPVLTSPMDGAMEQPVSSLMLSWQNATGASTYNVQLSLQSNFGQIAQQLSGISTNLVQVFELDEATNYFWRVQSSGPGGLSEWSMPFSFTTAGSISTLEPPTLQAPSNGATGITPGSVAVSWSGVAGATQYDVQIATVSDFSVVAQERGDIDGTSVTITGLAANTEYFWRARAEDGSGASDWSSAYSFTTGDGNTITEMVALDMMSPSDTYYGLHGGLVDNGTPTVTSTNGKIVIIAISMSNGHQEFDRFMELYENSPEISSEIVLINCATPGSAIERWIEPNGDQWPGCKDKVTKKHTLDQVKVVWAKNADQFTEDGITLPHPEADYYDLTNNIGALMQRIHQEFPSVQAVFNSSRIYGGYVNDQKFAARGEPISYEGGFATNTVIEQFQQGLLPDAPPWIGWGPYLWANGTTPNASGIFWDRTDFQGTNGDNQHPSINGSTKVADALHEFFMQFDWYRN